MADIYFFNTLTRKKERFAPIKSGFVGIYSCGPTVYWNQHVGHMYAYVMWDSLVRFLRWEGFKVRWVMNITDVGHMTSEEDTGEDKMEKGAKREGLSVWQIADKYIAQFKESLKLLGITPPDISCRATENIPEQIALAKKIEKNGFAYRTKKGLVFDTSKFPDYAKFANLNLEETKSRTDVEADPEKKLPWDFFLWAVNPKHIMKWPSPWGEGYPGWHLECTTMSIKFLGERFDIHTGGVDHIPVHHTNEIAQGFAAFDKQTANFWLHNGMLGGKGGEKMSKSLGNFVTVQDLMAEGYDPSALRYLILTSHYRKGLNFSFASLDAAQEALNNLREIVSGLKGNGGVDLEYRQKFESALADDLNTPQALAILWEMLKSNLPTPAKYNLALSFDEVLGLQLDKPPKRKQVPGAVKQLLEKRDNLRKKGKFEEADKIRRKILDLGFKVKDEKIS